MRKGTISSLALLLGAGSAEHTFETDILSESKDIMHSLTSALLSPISDSKDSLKSHITDFGCDICNAGSTIATMTLENPIYTPLFIELIKLGCRVVIPFIGYKPETCPGIIDQQFANSILPLIANDVLGQKNLCVFQLQLCERGDWVSRNQKQEVFNLLSNKPELAKSNDFINNLYKENRADFRKPGREPIKIAMVSDLHIDLEYTEGANSDCGKPLCCRTDSGPAPSDDKRAGKWGDFNCDLNQRTFDSLL
jgi:hypothetical protein